MSCHQDNNPPPNIRISGITEPNFYSYFAITSVLIDISAHTLHQNKGKSLGHIIILIKYIIFGDAILSKTIINNKTQSIAPTRNT